MSTLIEQIKQRYPLIKLVRENIADIKPTKPDGWYLGRCPFCQRAGPKPGEPRSQRKFWVDDRPGKGFCSCFRKSCRLLNPGQRPMDVINFYARLHNLTNRLAIFELADQLGLLPETKQNDYL